MSKRTTTAWMLGASIAVSWSMALGCGGKSSSEEEPSSEDESSSGGRPVAGDDSSGGVIGDCFPSACCPYGDPCCPRECPPAETGAAGNGGGAGQAATEPEPCRDESGDGLADLTMRLTVECVGSGQVEAALCNRGLAEAPASLHFSIYSGDELLCAGNAGSAVAPGHCVPAPCALETPLEPRAPLTATVNDGEPPLPECIVSNNVASHRGCE